MSAEQWRFHKLGICLMSWWLMIAVELVVGDYFLNLHLLIIMELVIDGDRGIRDWWLWNWWLMTTAELVVDDYRRISD